MASIPYHEILVQAEALQAEIARCDEAIQSLHRARCKAGSRLKALRRQLAGPVREPRVRAPRPMNPKVDGEQLSPVEVAAVREKARRDTEQREAARAAELAAAPKKQRDDDMPLDSGWMR